MDIIGAAYNTAVAGPIAVDLLVVVHTVVEVAIVDYP